MFLPAACLLAMLVFGVILVRGMSLIDCEPGTGPDANMGITCTMVLGILLAGGGFAGLVVMGLDAIVGLY